MSPSGVISHSTLNKKVKNATPLEYNGIHFKSKLEMYCYKLLKDYNVPVEYEVEKFPVLDPFVYNGEKVRGMIFTPDFVGDNFVVECKGFMNDPFPIRWKLFKHYLYKNQLRYDLYLPRNKKDVEKVVQEIVNNLKGRLL